MAQKIIEQGFDPKNRVVTLSESYQVVGPTKRQVANAKKRLKRAKINWDNALKDLGAIQDRESQQFGAAQDYADKAKEAYDKVNEETSPIINAKSEKRLICYLVAKLVCHIIRAFTSKKKAEEFYQEQLASTQNQ